MKKRFSLLIICSFLTSCKTTIQKNSEKEAKETSINTSEEDVTTYFKATGNEPFWGIKI